MKQPADKIKKQIIAPVTATCSHFTVQQQQQKKRHVSKNDNRQPIKKKKLFYGLQEPETRKPEIRRSGKRLPCTNIWLGLPCNVSQLTASAVCLWKQNVVQKGKFKRLKCRGRIGISYYFWCIQSTST